MEGVETSCSAPKSILDPDAPPFYPNYCYHNDVIYPPQNPLDSQIEATIQPVASKRVKRSEEPPVGTPLVDEAGNELRSAIPFSESILGRSEEERKAPPPPPPLQSRTSLQPLAYASSWDEAYDKSSHWGAMWKQAHSEQDDWPEGMVLNRGRMIFGSLMAVPESEVGKVLDEWNK